MQRTEPAVVAIDVPFVDYTTGELFAGVLDRAVAGGPAIVDLSRVERMGSFGLRALIAAAKATSGFFAVAAPQPLVSEVLGIGRLALVFPIFDSIDEARRAAAGS